MCPPRRLREPLAGGGFLAARRWLFWLYGPAALFVLIVFGRGSATAGLVLGTWLPLPVLLVGWRLGTKAAALA